MQEKMSTFYDAIKQGDLTTLEQILSESTVLLQTQDVSGLSPVLTAAYHHHPEVAELLVKHGAVLNLYEACASGHVDRVRALLAIDTVQVNTFAFDGYQPLGLAAFFGHDQVVELLLSAGADVNTPSNNDLRAQPLNSAAAGGHVRAAQLLLEHGADPNARQAEDFTPLHASIQNGSVELARLLLQHGADPNGSRARGKTPLEMARELGHTQLEQLLAQS
jgi:uncharacterized protein